MASSLIESIVRIGHDIFCGRRRPTILLSFILYFLIIKEIIITIFIYLKIFKEYLKEERK